MTRSRSGPDSDRLIVARLDGIAGRHARRLELTEDETAAAIAALSEVAGDRQDLLAEAAGLLRGFYAGRPEEPWAHAAAELCVKAGADIDQVAQWTEEGRRRAETARLLPFSRPCRPQRRP